MRRIVLLLLVLLAGACSMRSAIEAMSSPEDRASAEEMVERLRRGDSEWLRARFDPDGGGRWTVTTVATFSAGGPDRVVRWSVVPHDSAPPQLTVIETFEAALPWIWGTLVVVLALIAGLIFWLVRRSRSRARAQGVGTP